MKIWLVTEEEILAIDRFCNYDNPSLIRYLDKKRKPDIEFVDSGAYVNLLSTSKETISSTVANNKDYWIVGQYDDIIEQIKKLHILEQLKAEVER
jgi:hypothetical protein